MKRLLLPVCIVLIAIVLFSGFSSTEDGPAPVRDPASVSEAAFHVRNSSTQDVTSFLVGAFRGDQGTKLSFDGVGGIRRTAVNLDTEEGEVTLSQTEAGAALLQVRFGDELRLYTFRLTSELGEFLLTDANGNSERFTPIP